MAPCPGDGIGQVLFCMGNTEISVQLAGQYYCGGGGVVAAAIGVVAAVNPRKSSILMIFVNLRVLLSINCFLTKSKATTFSPQPMENPPHTAASPRSKMAKRTYNTKDSLVVTDPTTSLALAGLSMGERTGSRVLQWVWSYVAG